MAQIDPKRAKKLGELIQAARAHSDHTSAECAQILGISLEEYEQAETGEYPVSLPQLEALAIFFKVTMGYFWGSDTLSQDPAVDYDDMIALRNRVIGVLLNQLRLRAHRSRKETAEQIGVSEAVLEAYEMGDTAVPYLHLEQLARYLDGSLSLFMEDIHGPLARHETRQLLLKQFDRMTPEMRAFITNPVNVSYMETARKLSQMDVRQLRQIAEDLLEITF
ncbi:MAG: helix-turn-helix domain-containing protein [Anaerolineae bacterium]|nr:helix-turn-helix domain-containing protein [Anaerolineae bacterium]